VATKLSNMKKILYIIIAFLLLSVVFLVFLIKKDTKPTTFEPNYIAAIQSNINDLQQQQADKAKVIDSLENLVIKYKKQAENIKIQYIPIKENIIKLNLTDNIKLLNTNLNTDLEAFLIKNDTVIALKNNNVKDVNITYAENAMLNELNYTYEVITGLQEQQIKETENNYNICKAETKELKNINVINENIIQNQKKEVKKLKRKNIVTKVIKVVSIGGLIYLLTI
jgi:Ca2+/Na+ antiporter